MDRPTSSADEGNWEHQPEKWRKARERTVTILTPRRLAEEIKETADVIDAAGVTAQSCRQLIQLMGQASHLSFAIMQELPDDRGISAMRSPDRMTVNELRLVDYTGLMSKEVSPLVIEWGQLRTLAYVEYLRANGNDHDFEKWWDRQAERRRADLAAHTTINTSSLRLIADKIAKLIHAHPTDSAWRRIEQWIKFDQHLPHTGLTQVLDVEHENVETPNATIFPVKPAAFAAMLGLGDGSLDSKQLSELFKRLRTRGIENVDWVKRGNRYDYSLRFANAVIELVHNRAGEPAEAIDGLASNPTPAEIAAMKAQIRSERRH